jgi:hypothetical protein
MILPRANATCRRFRVFRGRTGFSSTVSTATSRCTSTCDRQQAKFWLAPVALAWNHGFSTRELNDIRRLIVEHEQAIIGAWHEHCGQR